MPKTSLMGEPSTDTAAAALPRSFGRYVLFDHIGRGGMADIFLAQLRTSLGGARKVVLKQVLPRLGDDPKFRAMLTEEAKLAANLNHANVVQVFDFGEEDGRLFIAMDYVEGFDLRTLLGRLSRAKIGLPAEFALLILRDALKGLDYAHRARDDDGRRLGIVHRDMSPSNVLISFEGEVKLCDFGIARAMRDVEPSDEPSGVKEAPRIVGKAAYMSPEQARGEAVDARSDLFAAGILLWETCAGRRLYRGTEDEMLALARKGEVPPLPERGLPDAPRLQRILGRATAPSPADRYASAADFLHDLESYAIDHKLMASPLRLGSFLSDHFAEEIVSTRREREKLAASIETTEHGPSSAPPPGLGAADVQVPPPPAVPPELLGMEPAIDDGLPRPTEDDAGSEDPHPATVVEPTPPGVRAALSSMPPGMLSPPTLAAKEVDSRPPLGTPDPDVVRRVSSRPRAPQRSGLRAFTPAWYALVLGGAALFGALVYFVLR